MQAKVRDTEIYFDIEGMGLVPDGRHDARAAGRLRDPWRARRRSHRVQAGLHAARRAHAARLFRSSRSGPVGARRRREIHISTRMSRTWRRCGSISASARSSPSARAMAAWWRWRMRRAIRPASRISSWWSPRRMPGSTRAPGRSSPSAARRSRRKSAASSGRASSRPRRQMRHYYAVMGPMYSRKHDPKAAETARGRVDPLTGRAQPRLRAGRLPAKLRSAPGTRPHHRADAHPRRAA